MEEFLGFSVLTLGKKRYRKMNLTAYTKLLRKKINMAHKMAKNPFVDSSWSYNPFNRPMYTTVVWIEPDENVPNDFRRR